MYSLTVLRFLSASCRRACCRILQNSAQDADKKPGTVSKRRKHSVCTGPQQLLYITVTILPCSYSEGAACVIYCTLTQPKPPPPCFIVVLCTHFNRSRPLFVKIPLIDHITFTLCKINTRISKSICRIKKIAFVWRWCKHNRHKDASW
jgi:hypothetical protein